MRTVFLDYKKAILAFFALLLVGPAQGQSAVEEFDWQRPGTDFSVYEAFLIKPLDLSDVKVLKPVWEQDDPEEWTFEGGTVEAIQGMFMRIMTEALSEDDGYRIVSEGGEDVLQLEVEFLSITPYVKPGTVANEHSGDVISTLGSGDVVVSAELRDSVTGSLLAVVEGERQIGTEHKELSRKNHIENLESTFRLWGNTLRSWMDAERAK